MKNKAEESFRKHIETKHPRFWTTKKGMPDFMVLSKKKNEIEGFVEVKRIVLDDNLRKEQEMFRAFCVKYKVPYQIWSPGMDKIKSKKLKDAMMRKTTKWQI